LDAKSAASSGRRFRDR